MAAVGSRGPKRRGKNSGGTYERSAASTLEWKVFGSYVGEWGEQSGSEKRDGVRNNCKESEMRVRKENCGKVISQW